MKWIKNNR